MNPRARLIQQQLQFAHQALEGTIADCDDKTLHVANPGATISTAAAIYAHSVVCEDVVIHGLQGKPPILQSQGWDQKLGGDIPVQAQMDAEWAKAFRIDLPLFREYAQAVYSEVDAFLSTLSDTDLDRKVATGTTMGEQTIGFMLGPMLTTHAPMHTGEIAALKGVLGLKGLPF